MKEMETCGICRESHPRDQLIEFDGELYCSDCLARETIICIRCGERIWNDDNAGDCGTPLCLSCYNDYYTSCTRCGRLLHRDDANYEGEYEDEPYCSDCHSQFFSDQIISDYYYKPSPIFYGNGNRFFGVELEVDDAGECEDSAEAVIDIANSGGKTHIYCKHDGSLDDGFEIVTHPMTLDYHCNSMPWERILNELRSMGYLSHKANTCGLHIHVNRNALGSTQAEQDACIARILYFFEKHWEELLKFSRRTEYQLSRWAARYGYKDQPKELLDHAKKGTGNGRYVCINLQNTDTIEFRIFRGTLKYNTLIATLQLVDRICDVAFYMTDDDVKSLSWTSFVSGCSQPELIQYLKERRLYVNEPVSGEEEV